MDRHISFEEMVEFLNRTTMEKKDMKAIMEMNRHIFNCRECNELYHTLLNFEDFMESLESPEKLIVNQVLEVMQGVKDAAAQLVIKVSEGLEVLESKLSDDEWAFNFMHPLALGSRGAGDTTKDQKVVIDDENSINKLTYDADKITMELDREILPEGTSWAVLVSDDGSYIDIQKINFENSVGKVEFKITEETTYQLYVQ